MSPWEFVKNIFLALGGLGLFLHGLAMMSDGLKKLARDRMRAIIEKATSNRFFAFLAGMIITVIIQSSTATSVMAIGFINAGLMTLSQFIGVVIGATVGTTSTAFLISFRIDPFAPLFIFTGVCLFLFSKRKKIKNIGIVITGIGVLFFGLATIGDPFKTFSELDGFQRMLTALQNPLLAFIAGLVFTAIIQSSAASLSIVITMSISGVHLDFNTVAFLLLGSHVGTCSTALLSSLAGSRESKRAALAFATYKVICGVLFGAILATFPAFIGWFESAWSDIVMRIAMYNLFYSLSTATVMIFFTGQLAAFVHWLMPRLPEEDRVKQLLYLGKDDEPSAKTTFKQAYSEIIRMSKMVFVNLGLAIESFYDKDPEKAAAVMDTEETIDYLKSEITAYLIHIRSSELSPTDIETLSLMLHMVSDLERIGDHAENIAEYSMSAENQSAFISDGGMEDLHILSDTVLESLRLALEISETRDSSLISQVENFEQNVDDLAKLSLEKHVWRLKNEVCDPRGGIIFTNMVSDLERCGDHAHNIANAFVNNKLWGVVPVNA